MKKTKFLRISLLLLYFVTISSNNFAETMFKDNFQDPSQWRYIGDNVMGGVSKGNVEFKIIDGEAVAILSGNVTTENNGGFIQIRRNLNDFKLEDSNSIRLVAKGNSQKYYIFLRTAGTKLPWQYYKAEFTPVESFNEFILPIDKFEKSGMLMTSKINPKKITSVGIVAFGRNHSADITIKELEFLN
ncbi:CIA30 family protein [Pelagibacteraceae bacterium]|nr:CIA30 family protein [Pelagibacteraceae bacterium]